MRLPRADVAHEHQVLAPPQEAEGEQVLAAHPLGPRDRRPVVAVEGLRRGQGTAPEQRRALRRLAASALGLEVAGEVLDLLRGPQARPLLQDGAGQRAGPPGLHDPPGQLLASGHRRPPHLQEAVVDREVGAARGYAPGEDVDEAGRHVPPDRRLAECARPGDERRHERGRVAHGRPLAERPGQHGHPAPAVGEDLHRAGPQPAQQPPVVPGRPGHVLAARRRDVAQLVGLGRHPPHRVEGDAGQRAHLDEIVGEGLGRRSAVAGARGGVEPGAPRGEVAVELLHRPEGRDRNQEVAPQEPHGVLDGALLVAGVGVAVPGLEAVAGPELREQPRLGDLAADHPARLGGVVEDHHPGGAPPALEYLGQPRAHALRRLRARRDALAVVRARQRRRQQLEVELLAGDDGTEVAVVGLAGPRRPLELQVALAAARRPRLPPVEHEPADRRVGPLVAPLVDEPVEDPLGGVELLAGRPEVGLEHRLDPGLVALERGPPPPLGTPSASIERISFLTSRDTVISSILPGRARQSCRPGNRMTRAAPLAPGRGPLDQTAQLFVTTVLRKP